MEYLNQFSINNSSSLPLLAQRAPVGADRGSRHVLRGERVAREDVGEGIPRLVPLVGQESVKDGESCLWDRSQTYAFPSRKLSAA